MNSLLVETNFQNFEENCIIFNAEFDQGLEDLVRKSFDLDELGLKDQVRTSGLGFAKNPKRPENEWTPAEKLIDGKMIVTQVSSNPKSVHYTCTIPWKGEGPNLVNNINEVLARQRRTNSSDYLVKKGTSLKEIDEKFQDQIKKGYIEKIDIKKENIYRKDSYFLSYFPVVNRTKDTSSLRIVFDAKAKDKSGSSMNGAIEKGPNRLNDLFAILLRFRRFHYAFTADISEMFLRIRLTEADKRYHRFWWNENFWQWNRILFGNRASPDISQKVITTHALKMKESYPEASRALIEDTYMDDTIVSRPSEEECVKIVETLPKVTEGMDMKIQKFYSNSRLALKSLPENLLSTKVHFSDKEEIFDSNKVLGMVWDANTDLITYNAKYKNADQFIEAMSLKKVSKGDWTKRLILRLSATVYDPLGLISPFTIRARTILQALWGENLEWDTPVPEKFISLWKAWLEELFELPNFIKIPRHLGFGINNKIELHVFVDASTKVFAATVYARILEMREPNDLDNGVTARGENQNHCIAVTLITAKARVAPTKTESVSRLELAACVIGTRLGLTVANALDLDKSTITFWTDSTNCLYWINSPSSNLKTFVSNRVGEVHTHSNPNQWKHIPTDINPADIPTRLPKISDLADNSLWWNGPRFLSDSMTSWPKPFVPPTEVDDEAKNEFKKLFIGNIDIAQLGLLDPCRYSVGKVWNGFDQLISLASEIFKLANPRRDFPRANKLALQFLIRRSQANSLDLQEIMHQLRTEKQISKPYRSFLPFIDKAGILRSKSRLANVDYLDYEVKFPAILDKQDPFTRLMIRSFHFKFAHTVGNDCCKAEISKGYVMIGLENYLKTVKSKCLVCQRYLAIPLRQQMSALPSWRFQKPLRAFAKCGLDFAGPFELKAIGRGKARPKTYLLLFTCLQTRAVHLELTEAMSMSATLNAISRFVDIRGMPTSILSDNFSTFVSKDKDLENWVRTIQLDDLISTTKAKVQWHFIPPRGPHHGGVYERMVGVAKRALESLCHYSDLTVDEFRTMAYKVANLVNSRPLSRLSLSEGDLILTPNHFLFGNLGGSVTVENITSHSQRWHKICELLDQFWSIFLEKTLLELRNTKKWQVEQTQLAEGDLVVEIDSTQPRGCWKLAVVEQVHPSDDSKVRKVTIRNSKGQYIRPIVNLIPLKQKVI